MIENTANVTDAQGEYSSRFFDRNWSMSPEQLELMVSYSLDHIQCGFQRLIRRRLAAAFPGQQMGGWRAICMMGPEA